MKSSERFSLLWSSLPASLRQQVVAQRQENPADLRATSSAESMSACFESLVLLLQSRPELIQVLEGLPDTPDLVELQPPPPGRWVEVAALFSLLPTVLKNQVAVSGHLGLTLRTASLWVERLPRPIFAEVLRRVATILDIRSDEENLVTNLVAWAQSHAEPLDRFVAEFIPSFYLNTIFAAHPREPRIELKAADNFEGYGSEFEERAQDVLALAFGRRISAGLRVNLEDDELAIVVEAVCSLPTIYGAPLNRFGEEVALAVRTQELVECTRSVDMALKPSDLDNGSRSPKAYLTRVMQEKPAWTARKIVEVCNSQVESEAPLSELQEAAVLLESLPELERKIVLHLLRPDMARQIFLELVRAPSVTPRMRNRVVRRFLHRARLDPRNQEGFWNPSESPLLFTVKAIAGNDPELVALVLHHYYLKGPNPFSMDGEL